MKFQPLWSAAAIVLLTAVSFWWFPGHTILQSDTQIYIPILQHLQNPDVLARDAMAVRPHVAFTIFDEVALALKGITRASFEKLLLTQEILFRGLGILGLFLFARGAGLNRRLSFAVAALVSLGATVNGPQVLTVEYEPVPRGFAFCLVLLSLGLAAVDRWTAASAAAALAVAFHPPSAAPVFVLMAFLLIARHRWRDLAVMTAGLGIVGLALWLQPPGTEGLSLFGRIDPELEAVQRMRASYNWVETWIGKYAFHYSFLLAAALAAAWRLRAVVSRPIRVFLFCLPVAGALSVLASWLLVDHWKLLIGPQYQPARYLMYVPFFTALSCGIAGVRAAAGSRFGEAFLFLVIPFAVPLETNFPEFSAGHITLCGGLALAMTMVRGELLRIVPPLLAFVLYPTAGKVVNYPAVHNAELTDLASWAKQNTPREAVFQFADVRRGAEPGIFRARAERAIYADWKAGGQVNFLPDFARLWAGRWKRVERAQPIAVYRDLKIDYVVFSTPKAPRSVPPVYSNGRWVVVRTTSPID